MSSSTAYGIGASISFLMACIMHVTTLNDGVHTPGNGLFFMGMSCYFMLRRIDSRNDEKKELP